MVSEWDVGSMDVKECSNYKPLCNEDDFIRNLGLFLNDGRENGVQGIQPLSFASIVLDPGKGRNDGQ